MLRDGVSYTNWAMEPNSGVRITSDSGEHNFEIKSRLPASIDPVSDMEISPETGLSFPITVSYSGTGKLTAVRIDLPKNASFDATNRFFPDLERCQYGVFGITFKVD